MYTHTHTYSERIGVKQEYTYDIHIILQESRITAVEYIESGKAGVKHK